MYLFTLIFLLLEELDIFIKYMYVGHVIMIDEMPKNLKQVILY